MGLAGLWWQVSMAKLKNRPGRGIRIICHPPLSTTFFCFNTAGFLISLRQVTADMVFFVSVF
jgi:hypothetical protein